MVYLIEVNPRASRTVPFVAKAIGIPIAKIAARVMAGEKLIRAAEDRPRRPPYRGQGGGLPLRALPRHRSRALAGDEVYRRSDGDRRDFIGRGSTSRPAAPCSSRSRTATSRRSSRGAGPARDGLPRARDRGHRRIPLEEGLAVQTVNKVRRAGRTSSTGSRTAASTSSSTPPRAGRATRTPPRSALRR
jgi:hypothetical protein